jgi:predicted RNase H-like HicB family nuclease
VFAVPLTVLIEKGRERPFTAHCLELDLVVDGPSVEEVLKNIEDVICAHMDYATEYGISPFNPAPKEYWDKLRTAEQLEVQRFKRDKEKCPIGDVYPYVWAEDSIDVTYRA